MMFIGMALLVAVGLTLIIVVDAGSLVGLSQEQTGQIIPLLLILILVAGGAFGRQIKLSQIISNIFLWAVIFLIVIVGYSYRAEIINIKNRVFAEFSPQNASISQNGSSVLFNRSYNGSFQIKAQVNGVNLPMIFDTGASSIVLSLDDAKKVGINISALKYTIKMQTANGISYAALSTIKNIEVGNIERRNIKAFVTKDGALETSLLGMNFLRTLSSYSVKGDKLEFVN